MCTQRLGCRQKYRAYIIDMSVIQITDRHRLFKVYCIVDFSNLENERLGSC